MAINVSDLPPKYQAQAMKKYMEQQQRRGPAPPAAPPQDLAKGTKYHNTPTERVTASGAVLHFDSQKEARRFDVLAARQARGQIRDLRLQVDFTLQEAFTDTEGKRVGRSATRRILHTTSRQTGSYTEVMRHTTQNKAGCPGSSSWRT